jgi:CheY-like chemotaxis protein
VLVVEDEVLLRLVVAEYLRDCGFKVIEAAHADEALMVLKQPDLRIDVLFSDIEMPGSMDGFALAQWTRTNCPGLAVMLTGSVPRAVNAAAICARRGRCRSRTSRGRSMTGFGGSWRAGRSRKASFAPPV